MIWSPIIFAMFWVIWKVIATWTITSILIIFSIFLLVVFSSIRRESRIHVVGKPFWTDDPLQAALIGKHNFVDNRNTANTLLIVDESKEQVGHYTSGDTAMKVTITYSLQDRPSGRLIAKWKEKVNPPSNIRVSPYGSRGPVVPTTKRPAFHILDTTDDGKARIICSG